MTTKTSISSFVRSCTRVMYYVICLNNGSLNICLSKFYNYDLYPSLSYKSTFNLLYTAIASAAYAAAAIVCIFYSTEGKNLLQID